MSGQNTHKQIIAMVILMFLGVASLGAYVWFDDGRRAEAEDEQLIESSERGARLFANNCRVCHGNAGEGSNRPGLIGLPLNTPANTLAFRSDNSGALGEIQARLRATIECGRNGTAMPPWAIENGGSLNFFHIDSLVTLITTNSANIWEEALALAIEQDEFTLQGLEDALAAAESGATDQGVADTVNAALDQASGDAAAALAEAVLQLSRTAIADQVDAELGEDLAAAEDAGDETAVEQIEAQMLVREGEILDELVADALGETGGDAVRALTRARVVLAESALANAQANLDRALTAVEAGRPIQQPSPSLTSGTCGQGRAG